MFYHATPLVLERWPDKTDTVWLPSTDMTISAKTLQCTASTTDKAVFIL